MVEKSTIRNFVLVAGLSLTPIYLLTLSLFTLYRVVCHLILKYTDSKYRGLLNILQLLFANDRGPNRSVLTGYAWLKLTKINSCEDLQRALIKMAKQIISADKNEKIVCNICKSFGLNYWRLTSIDLEKQIRLFDVSNAKQVHSFISKIANDPISDNKLWEMHIGRNPIDGKHPVVLRVHHSAGDGYAFRQILMEMLPGYKESKGADDSPMSLVRYCESFKKKLILGVHIVLMFVLAPSLCILQYMEPFDKNSLKTYNLSGEKQSGSSSGEFRKIKQIQTETNCTTTEVILAALSNSLDDLFKDRHESVSHLTVSYAIRMSQESSGLENEFIPVAVRLPVSLDDTLDAMKRLNTVNTAVKQIQRRPTFMKNFQLPKFALAFLPWGWPDWVYRSTDMTVLFSNVPGPTDKVVFEEFEVEDCTCYLMNLQAYNGCGVMLSTYMDKCAYSVILDKALTRNKDDAQRIVDGIVNYIEHMFLLINERKSTQKVKIGL